MIAISPVIRTVAVTAVVTFSVHAAAGADDWDIRDQVRIAKPRVAEPDTASDGENTGCEHFSSKARKYTKDGPCIAVSGHVEFSIGNVSD